MRSSSFTLVLLASVACASVGCGVPFPVPASRYGVRYEVLVPTSTLPRCSEEHPTGCSLDGMDPAETSEAAPDPEPATSVAGTYTLA
jgi:hypothetical protein